MQCYSASETARYCAIPLDALGMSGTHMLAAMWNMDENLQLTQPLLPTPPTYLNILL